MRKFGIKIDTQDMNIWAVHWYTRHSIVIYSFSYLSYQASKYHSINSLANFSASKFPIHNSSYSILYFIIICLCFSLSRGFFPRGFHLIFFNIKSDQITCASQVQFCVWIISTKFLFPNKTRTILLVYHCKYSSVIFYKAFYYIHQYLNIFKSFTIAFLIL